MALSEKEIETLWQGSYVENYVNEMASVLREIDRMGQCRSILEIGVNFGGTLRLWESVVPPGHLVVGVDKDPATIGKMTGKVTADRTSCAGGGLVNNWELAETYGIIHRFVSDREVFVVIGDSAAPEVAAAVQHLLRGRKFDVLFHDGIHYGPGPVYDYYNFEDMLRDYGLLCVADVGNMGLGNIDNLGTQTLWQALPPPKTMCIEPCRAGIATWIKQPGFRIDPKRVVAEAGLSYYGNGPTGSIQHHKVFP